MWFNRIFILFFASIIIGNQAFTQQTPVKTDSTNLYKNIDTYSKRNKFSRSIYHLIFKPIAKKSPKKKAKKKTYKKLIQKPYSSFEGKTIRHINIETLDPFGYSISDTNITPQNFILKSGNKLHIKSQHITIRNLLLIRQNQTFDSLLVKESERLVRSQSYVRDVSFFVLATSKYSDSVDIFIRELDNWSILPNMAASGTNLIINLNDKNFAGLGHDSQNDFYWYHSTGDIGYNFKYYMPNIRNSFINSTLIYGSDQYKNSIKSFAVDRPFFSPFAKWAAGMSFSQQDRQDSIRFNNSFLVQQRFKFNVQDFWAGNAIQLFKGNTEQKRTTNFISAIRYLRVRYIEKPTEELNKQHFFSNEDFYLATIGISTRKYVQDKYIFKFGVTEDVPIGKVFSITSGYQVKNNAGRLYLGARIALGYYYTWGYISSNLEYGTFIRASQIQQGNITANINYFTGLIEIGKWKFRHFIKPQITIGINRFSSDSLTLNDGYGLDGFNSPELTGTSRLLFTFQTQAYAPWNFIGFRFGPFIIYSAGILGNAESGFKESKIYSQLGLGVLVKNENLVLNTFQVSIAFYPIIPGTGQNILKINSFRSTDFGFRDYEIGKPDVIIFQ